MPLSKAVGRPKLASAGTARYELIISLRLFINPWGLSLPGPWPEAHGSHLTYRASEDIRANGHGGPVTHPGSAIDDEGACAE